MLVVDSSKRSESHVVWKALNNMRKRCRMDDDYAVMGRPWSDPSTQIPQIMEVRTKKANDMEPAEPGLVVEPKAAQKKGKRAKGKKGRKAALNMV